MTSNKNLNIKWNLDCYLTAAMVLDYTAPTSGVPYSPLTASCTMLPLPESTPSLTPAGPSSQPPSQHRPPSTASPSFQAHNSVQPHCPSCASMALWFCLPSSQRGITGRWWDTAAACSWEQGHYTGSHGPQNPNGELPAGHWAVFPLSFFPVMDLQFSSPMFFTNCPYIYGQLAVLVTP